MLNRAEKLAKYSARYRDWVRKEKSDDMYHRAFGPQEVFKDGSKDYVINGLQIGVFNAD